MKDSRRVVAKILLFIALILIFTGCSGKRQRQDLVQVWEHVYDKGYVLGEIKTAYIGDTIIKVRDRYIHLGTECLTMTASEDFKLAGNYTQKKFLNHNVIVDGKKQTQYISNDTVELDGQQYLIADVRDIKGVAYGLLIDKSGRIMPQTICNGDHDYLMPSKDAVLLPHEAKLIKSDPATCKNNDKKSQSFIDGSINYELLYGGINNVTLAITYREFTIDDMARPSFFQNLVYETSAKQFRFKDFKIEIIEANNEKLVYRVVDDGLKEIRFHADNPPLDFSNNLKRVK